MNIAKPICKVLGIPCEFATSLGYCQSTVCVKVHLEGVKRHEVCYAINAVEDVNAVDAIPVEWLRKIANDTEIELNDRACIKWLIGEWQKEQTKEHCGPDYCEIE